MTDSGKNKIDFVFALASISKNLQIYEGKNGKIDINNLETFAENGGSLEQFLVGGIYLTGIYGVSSDYVRSYMWLTISFKNGEENISNFIDIAAKEMTPEQIAEAQKLAREWLAKNQK